MKNERSVVWACSMVLSLTNAICVCAANFGWALPRVSVVCVREAPGHASELGSQVVMGTPLKVLANDGTWPKVETPEGYHGFVISNSLSQLDDEAFDAWRRAKRVVVSSFDQTYVYACVDSVSGLKSRVADVVNGSVLEVVDLDGSSAVAGTTVNVKLPDGRVGYISATDVMPIEEWANESVDFHKAIEFAQSLMGTPYLWGGTSTKAMDCSGLTKLVLLAQGVILPRNASQQAKMGVAIDVANTNAFEPGDLLFFGNASTGRVNHVGMSLGGNRFIHCSGRVMESSLDPHDTDYIELSLLAVRRLRNADLSRLNVKNNSFYFYQK